METTRNSPGGEFSRRAFLAGLSAAAGGAASLVSAQAIDGLRSLAVRHGMRVGIALHDEALRNAAFLRKVAQEADHVTLKSLTKRRHLEPAQGKFNWDATEQFFPWLKRHNMRMHGHTLVWYDGNPPWLNRALEAPNAPLSLVTEYVASVADRFKGRVMSWDVVNECFIPTRSGPAVRPSREFKNFGLASIETPFHIVKEVDPAACRILNQNFLTTARSSDHALRAFFLLYLSDALRRGVPIQAVGLQCHLQPGVLPFNAAILGNFLDALRKLGLHVILSEVTFATTAADNSRRDALAARELRLLLDTYFKYTSHEGWPPTVRFWGLSRKFSDYPGGRAEILTEDYQRTDSYLAVQTAIRDAQ